MVQRVETQINPSALQRRRSTSGNINLKITLTEDDSVANAFNNAVTYRETPCGSTEEVLKYCRTAISTRPRMLTPELGVHSLEKGDKHLRPADLRHEEIINNNSVPYLRSPRLMYHTKHEQSEPELGRFKFPHTKSSSRPKSLAEDTNFGPVLGAAAKNSFLLGAFNKAYTVESVSTALLKKNQNEGEMFMSTYTVVVLGELSVGKSALCRKFFHSGTNANENRSHQRSDSSFGLEDDDYLNSPTGTLDSLGRRTDDHHIYERPVTVDGQCVRIRILDINAEKHRTECSDSGDFEPYLEAGDAYALTYSVADRGTFKTVVDILSRMSTVHEDRSLPIILVGNKCDLVRKRQVTTASGIKLAAKYGVKFIETSASLNQNVKELFEGVIQQIRLRQQGEASSSSAACWLSEDSERSASSSKNTIAESTPDSATKKTKPHGRSSSLHKKRRYKRALTRRLTEFLGGGEKDSITSRAKSCQDLTVL